MMYSVDINNSPETKRGMRRSIVKEFDSMPDVVHIPDFSTACGDCVMRKGYGSNEKN